MSRLVQKGIVIRNSQKARTLGGRVAMNHAVGRPKAKVMSVVAIDSLTERQKIERFASARLMVWSKISRVNNTLNQPSPDRIQRTPE